MQENNHSDSNQNKNKFHLKIDKPRFITAGVLLALLFVIVYFENFYLVYFAFFAVYLQSMREALGLYEIETGFLPLLAASLLCLFCFLMLLYPFSGLMANLLFIFAILGFIAYKNSTAIKYVLPFIYPSLPLICLFTIYAIAGISPLLYVFLIVALTDSFAYFGGKKFGKRQLSISSPKKTIEGVVIGLSVASLLGMMIGSKLLGINIVFSFVISFVIAVASVFGDLFESYLKRRVNLKDSGNILPGHGGVLDRLDGTLFAGMVLVFVLSLDVLVLG